MGIRGSFPGGKAAGTWRWPLISFSCRSEEGVALYLHFQYFMGFAWLSTGTTFYLYFCNVTPVNERCQA
jgi:hypothetical protein